MNVAAVSKKNPGSSALSKYLLLDCEYPEGRHWILLMSMIPTPDMRTGIYRKYNKCLFVFNEWDSIYMKYLE